MVLCPKTRESRSPPSLSSAAFSSATFPHTPFSALSVRVLRRLALRIDGDAGWSSPVARQAHNLKVGGSNPPPATNQFLSYINGIEGYAIKNRAANPSSYGSVVEA